MLEKFILILILSGIPAAAWSQAGTLRIPYRGHLERDGAPLTGTAAMSFRLYDAAVSGTLLGTFERDVPVDNGAFVTDLGPVPEAALQGKVFVELSIDGVILGRQEVPLSPYSLRARTGGPVAAPRLTLHPAAGSTPLAIESASADGRKMAWSAGAERMGFSRGPSALLINLASPPFDTASFGELRGSNYVDGVRVTAGGRVLTPRFGMREVLTNAVFSGSQTAGSFTSSGGTILLFVSATAYHPSSGFGAGQILMLEVVLDGQVVGTLRGMANRANSHRPFPPAIIPIDNLPACSGGVACHTLLVRVPAGSTTLTDGAGVANATIIELPL